MFIPQGDWCVVWRHVRDSTSKGTIIKAGLTEAGARHRVTVFPIPSDWNVWVMRMVDY